MIPDISQISTEKGISGSIRLKSLISSRTFYSLAAGGNSTGRDYVYFFEFYNLSQIPTTI